MNDFDPSDHTKYRSFEDFFTRKHRAGSRPVHAPEDAASAVVVADSRVVAYESVTETARLWIKGSDFSIANLVMDTDLGARFAGAAVASFRLSPQDYHRYHAPVTGKVKLFRSEELGIFQFGGSSIIVAFEKGRVEFDQDIVELSKQRVQVAVEVGMSLGRSSRWSSFP
jgi:phosphatidylserine decarboxylase